MPAIFHIKEVDNSFEGAVQYVVDAQPGDDVVWHCEKVDASFDGAIFHVKKAPAGYDGPVWRIVSVSPGGEVVVVGPDGSPISLPDAIANSLEYLKAFGGTEQRNLPSGYTQVEYLESTGTQYIDTGYTFTLGNKLELVINPLNDNNVIFFGANSNGSELFLRNNTAYFGGNQLSGLFPTTDTIYDVVMDLDSQNASLAINNTSKFQGAASFNDKKIYLFASTGNSNLDVPTDYRNVRIYNFKITQNSTLVRNMVPAKRTSDNAIGMYDTVSGTFFTNAGTGTFTAGGEAVPTPDAPMDIVSNNGVLKYGVGKNLFDDELLLNATGWTKTDGIYSGTNGALYAKYGTSTDGFPLQYKANTQYTLSYTIVTSGSVNNARFRIYYTDNTYDDGPLSGIVTTPTTYTLTSASGKSISKIVYNYTNGSGNISLKDIQLEQGTTATPYEPYRVGIYTDGTVETLQIDTLPAGYTELEYIKGTGTQYINTNLTLPTSFEIEMEFAQSQDAAIGFLCGARSRATVNNDGFSILLNSGKIGFDFVDAEYRNILDYEDGWNSVKATISNTDCTFVVNGEQYNATAGASIGTTSKLYLFDTCTAGSGTSYKTTASVRKVVIKQGNTVLKNFIPAKRNSDNVLGMYDTVSGQFFTNAGTGTFIAGAPTNTATAEMLLKVGDYEDVQEILSGAITRNVGVKVFDGTEAWGAATTSGVRVFMTNLIGGYQYPLICTHFINGEPTTDNIIYIASGTQVLQIRYDTAPDVAGFKQWLADQYNAGTPVIVLYPLATPTTESVAGQAMQVQQGDNTLEITQASLDNLELEAKYTKES